MDKNILPVGLAALLLAGGAWGFSQQRKDARYRLAPRAKAGDLTLQPCTHKGKERSYQADCGTLVVQEMRSDPASRLIVLPVKRIRSASLHPAEPIFYLAGGPGQSNMDFQPPDALLADHDIVLVGYRGVDGTVKLDSPEMAKAMYGVGGDVTSPESLARIAAAMRACSARFQAEGIDLAGYTLPEVIADMEAARQALGYERIHLLSVSYGTRLAQIYAYLHAGRIFRSVMIGVNPPGHFVWEPRTIDAQIAGYSRLCAQDETCREQIPDLQAMMRSVAHGMPSRWLAFPIDPRKVNTVAFLLLFHRSTAGMVFDAYRAAYHGDPSGLALMSWAYDLLVPRASIFGDLLAKGSSADYQPGRDYEQSLRAPDSILGSPMSLLIWAPAAQGWPVYPQPAELSRVQPSDVETLLVNGSLDFSTPVEFGRDELLPALKNGRLVVLSELGHVGDFWQTQPQAAERLLTSFYTTGQADDSLFTYQPANFKPKISLPLAAKALLGGALGLLAALGALAGWGIYRWGKR